MRCFGESEGLSLCHNSISRVFQQADEFFEAEARLRDLLIAEDQACFEAGFVGRQVREFAGIVPTAKEICVPLCVVYELANGKITRGRLYFGTDALR